MRDPRVESRRLAGWLGAAMALALVVAASAAVVILLFLRAEAEAPAPAEPLPVHVRPAKTERGYWVRERYAGRIEPARETRLAFERDGLVTEVLVWQGDRVEAGQVIARLDREPLEIERRRLAAEAKQVAADLALARITFERRQTLAERGHETGQSLDEARYAVEALEARAAAIDARLAALALDNEKSELRTPFGGTVATRRIDEGAIVSAGAEVALLQETGRPRARIGLPPDRAAELAPGQALTVEAGGRQVGARLRSLSPKVDPATRTVAALLDLEPQAALAMGDVARLTLEHRMAAVGFHMPLAALSEGERGLWSLYVVEEGDDGPMARRAAVEVLHVADGEAFVRGPIAEGRPVIVAGVNRLAPGQSVRPLRD